MHTLTLIDSKKGITTTIVNVDPNRLPDMGDIVETMHGLYKVTAIRGTSYWGNKVEESH